MANGNHVFWYNKYSVAMGSGDDGDAELLYRDSGKKVCHIDMMFDAIKEVHLQSTRSCSHVDLSAC